MASSPYLHPDRKPPQFKPLSAMSHMRKLIADKEDTEQVFHIIEALSGKSLLKDLEKFASTEKGQTRMAERRHLPPILDGMRAELKQYPLGTVGRTYADFMEREGLSAQGLVDESEKFFSRREKYDDTLEWYGQRLRDTHDMFHILSGYGRDALGEDALLSFSWSQNGGFGLRFISYMGSREIQKEAPHGVNIGKVVQEARLNGAAASRIVEEDILALLDQPIDEVRARMGIAKPVLYKQALQAFQDAGIEPELVAA